MPPRLLLKPCFKPRGPILGRLGWLASLVSLGFDIYSIYAMFWHHELIQTFTYLLTHVTFNAKLTSGLTPNSLLVMCNS
jgi:hypothetical protein